MTIQMLVTMAVYFRYTPTTIWGKNGHFQTILHAILGRFGEKVFSKGKLYTLCGTDGATVTYTLYNGKDRKDSQEVSLPGFFELAFVNCIAVHMMI